MQKEIKRIQKSIRINKLIQRHTLYKVNMQYQLHVYKLATNRKQKIK